MAPHLSFLPLQNGEKGVFLWFLLLWGRAGHQRAETLSTVAKPFEGCGANTKYLCAFLLHQHLRSLKALLGAVLRHRAQRFSVAGRKRTEGPD